MTAGDRGPAPSDTASCRVRRNHAAVRRVDRLAAAHGARMAWSTTPRNQRRSGRPPATALADDGTASTFHSEQNLGQAVEPDRHKSAKVAARGQVDPVHLRRGDELPPVGRESLAGQDLLEALPHVHRGCAGAGGCDLSLGLCRAPGGVDCRLNVAQAVRRPSVRPRSARSRATAGVSAICAVIALSFGPWFRVGHQLHAAGPTWHCRQPSSRAVAFLEFHDARQRVVELARPVNRGLLRIGGPAPPSRLTRTCEFGPASIGGWARARAT
jgi:hypothetical protein